VSASVDTTSVGSGSASLTGSDSAGNTSTADCAYSVFYGFAGFFAPVNNPVATGQPAVINRANAGRTIPLKWRLTDASGSPVLGLASVKLTVEDLSCGLGTTADSLEEYATGSSGLQNLGDGYYQFNWATPKGYAGSCKRAALSLGDGSTSHYADFQFVK
jgi:hypothetical protein